MVFITLFLYAVLFVTYVFSANLELGGTIYSDRKTDPDYQRDVINGLINSITTAYITAHHTQQYGTAYISAKSSGEYTRTARQFCFGFLFSAIVKQCITINRGQVKSCVFKAGDCVLAYGDKPLNIDNPINNKSF